MNFNKRRKNWEDKCAEIKLGEYVIKDFIVLKYATIINTSYIKQIKMKINYSRSPLQIGDKVTS